MAGAGIFPILLGVGLDLALVPLLPRPAEAEECLRTEAGVLTGVLCWEDGVEVEEVSPIIMELVMEADMESVPEFLLGEERDNFLRSVELDRVSLREDWCSWTLLRIRLSFLSCSVSWLGSRGQVCTRYSISLLCSPSENWRPLDWEYIHSA